MRETDGRVPLTEWQFVSMGEYRREPLEAICFDDIAERIAATARLAEMPDPECVDDRTAPRGSSRFIYKLTVSSDLGDLLYNGRDGLRARHWLSPTGGERATRHLLSLLESVLLPDGLANRERRVDALRRPSSKIWVSEADLRADGASLFVPRWAENEGQIGDPLPGQWRFTPRATKLNVISAWVAPDGAEWVSPGKIFRSCQIHRWGFT